MQFSEKIIFISLILFVCSCSNKQENEISWTTYIDSIGTYSSPRTVDLNNDHVLDIVLGAGAKEEEFTDTAVIALDGASGKPLWAIQGHNQYVGAAVFQDITNDQIPDVFIGGRWAQFTAIDGSNGKILWSFFPERTNPDGSDGGWYNFTTPQFVPDHDNDGIQDLLVANGGDARAEPFDTNRPAGRLLLLSSKTGKIFSNVVVPDGKETYMSVVCENAGNDITVLFGTGGETIGGHLYKTTLSAIISGDIADAKILATSNNKGFVSSPVLADINRDGKKDIIINAVDGRMFAIDGKTDSVLWQLNFPGTEAYTMPAVGLFNEDSIPDFFANYAVGIFPKLNYSIRFMADGKTGRVEYIDTVPAFQYASAVVADLNGDGFDEAIINQSALKRKQFENVFYSYLLVFDFKNKKNYSVGDTLQYTNLASTPWIGDLNKDGMYDIIYTSVKYENAATDLQKPLGVNIHRSATNYKVQNKLNWSAFMGTYYNSNY